VRANIDPVPIEARPYQGRRAGLVTRSLSAAIDFGILLITLAVMYVGLCAFVFLLDPRAFSAPAPPLWAVYAVGYALLTLYLAVCWMGSGRTYGNHVMGLRVVNYDGGRLHPIGALLRAAFCAIFPLGLAWVLVSGANRSVQDVVLRTSVIYDWDVRPHQVREAEAAA